MLNSLYIEAAKKRGIIKEILPELTGEGSIPDMWEEIQVKPSSEDFSLAAGDGSFNKKNFLAFTFFAVGAESVIYNGEFKKIDDSIIDSIEHCPFIDDLLRLYMGVLELKSAINTIEYMDVDYYFIDGSLFGDLIRSFPKNILINKKRQEELLSLVDELKESVKYFNYKLQAKRLIDQYYPNYADKNDYIMFLTSIELLCLLKQLFQHKEKLIAISKTSINKDLFNSNIPDISIFDKYTKKAGISRIIYKKVENEVKFDFLVENEYFKKLFFTIFYLRLEDNKNVLKVELPYYASYEEILEIIKKIKKYSADGYPYLLKKAHKDVVITNKDMDSLAIMVNLQEKIGREMLR
ncbi:MAG: DNA double-strand break repair nuclease NurA [Methanobrevibacter sp.]|nr:DNA double-strand break repair nuclease NurA [Methanobrevibacter sp.]